MNAALTIDKISKNICNLIFISSHEKTILALKSYNLKVAYLKISKISKLFMLIKSNIVHPSLLKIVNFFCKKNKLENFLFNLKIDLLYFTSPSELPYFTDKFNFIYTVWDFSHRDEMEFPEIRENKVFDQREKKYKKLLSRAILVIVDSERSKINSVRRYGLDAERVLPIPFSPAIETKIDEKIYEKNFIDIKKKYELSFDYIFYPAQFWSHKNHIYILNGIKLLEEKNGLKIGAVFTGSDKGNKDHIISTAKQLGIYERVVFTGFVNNNEIPYIYKQSIALVMPSYFGPTNLPPLEAFQLGVPVIYGEIPGAFEQLSDSAIFINLNENNSFIEAIIKVKDASIRKELIKKGYNRLKKIDLERNLLEDKLYNKIVEYQVRRQTWR